MSARATAWSSGCLPYEYPAFLAFNTTPKSLETGTPPYNCTIYTILVAKDMTLLQVGEEAAPQAGWKRSRVPTVPLGRCQGLHFSTNLPPHCCNRASDGFSCPGWQERAFLCLHWPGTEGPAAVLAPRAPRSSVISDKCQEVESMNRKSSRRLSLRPLPPVCVYSKDSSRLRGKNRKGLVCYLPSSCG